MTQVVINIYQGAVVVKSAGKVIGRVGRDQTGEVVVNLEDAPDAEAPDTEKWEPFTRATTYRKGEEITDPNEETWRNNLYTVGVTRQESGAAYLTIRRNDRHWARDWRHFQRIKNELLGPEIEAMELFPAESRLVDAANQFHLWAFPPGVQIPVGFTEGRVVSSDSGEGVGFKQRPHVEDVEDTIDGRASATQLKKVEK